MQTFRLYTDRLYHSSFFLYNLHIFSLLLFSKKETMTRPLWRPQSQRANNSAQEERSGGANRIKRGGFAYTHHKLLQILCEAPVSQTPPTVPGDAQRGGLRPGGGRGQTPRFASSAAPLGSVCLPLEGGVRGNPAGKWDGGGGLRLVFFSWIFFFVSSFLTDSSPSLQCTQSPKMTFTKLATSVSLASWEVKKRCCWGGNGHRVSREPNQKKAIKASIPWTLRLSCCCVAVCIVIMVIRAFLCSCFQSDFSFWHLVYTHLLSSLVVTPLLPFLVKLYLVAILWRNINYIELNFFQLFNGTICIFMWTFCICL